MVASAQPLGPDLSIVLPSYRAASWAKRSVAELETALEGGSLSWEIIVVDDGGGDFAPDPWPAQPAVRLIRFPRNRGKGAAVVAGLLAARGRVRIFTDVDLPYGPQVLPPLAEYILGRGFHLVVGDRTLPSSSYDQALPWQRRLASAMCAAFVGKLVTGGFFDTQCGLKAIRGDVAEALLPMMQIRRFAFDVELIYLALVHRLDIKRIPVRLRTNETSSVRLLRDSARSACDVLLIKYHKLRGRYQSRALADLVARDFRTALEAASLAVPAVSSPAADPRVEPWR